MKGLTKKIMFGLFAVAVACCLVAFAGCSSTTKYTGEYTYENYGLTYGIVVEVTVNDSDNTIKSVKVLDSDYVSLSPAQPDYGWTDEMRAVWTDNLDDLLASYKGLTVSYVLGLTVDVEDTGEPYAVSDSNLVITGCTQGSGRLLLAVQNALKNA